MLPSILKPQNVITYRAEIAKTLQSIPAAILFDRIIYWWIYNDKKEFSKYKFPPKRQPNERIETFLKRTETYTVGSSWHEELAFERHQFDNALRKVAYYSKRKIKENLEERNRRIREHKSLIIDYYKKNTETKEEWYERVIQNLDKYIKCCISYRTDKNTNITYYKIEDSFFLIKFLIDLPYLLSITNSNY